VEQMFTRGVVDEVRGVECLGPTAEKMLGLKEIQALLAAKISQTECISTIQRLTRNYAKRQLTWFQRQDIFIPLNLSGQGLQEAIDSIAQSALSAFAHMDD
jgi:tRNA A37 N6-isopentenylltransferase MiaA